MAKFRTCEHIRQTDNNRCGSPALRGKHYCYYHERVHKGEAIGADHTCRIFPLLNSEREIKIAATQILHQLHLHHISPEEARLMLYAVRLASNILTQPFDLDGYLNSRN